MKYFPKRTRSQDDWVRWDRIAAKGAGATLGWISGGFPGVFVGWNLARDAYNFTHNIGPVTTVSSGRPVYGSVNREYGSAPSKQPTKGNNNGVSHGKGYNKYVRRHHFPSGASLPRIYKRVKRRKVILFHEKKANWSAWI